MNIDDLKIGEIKQLQAMLAGGASTEHWKVGENYFIRTVTNYLTGRLVSVSDQELVLADAAWIADAGRYSNAIKDGVLSEVEPYPDGALVIVGRGAIVDATAWLHDLPREQQ